MTRDHIIELAKHYMQSIGYHSFNYKLISSQLNIKNASIHYYFPTKEDLALAVIEKDKDDFNMLVKSLEGKPSMQKAEALLNHYIHYFKDGKKLCVISTFGSSFNDVSEKIRHASKAYGAMVMKWLADIFSNGLKTGEFKFKEQPEEMAASWMAALPGSLIVGRMHGASYFDKVIASLKSGLKRK